MLRKYIPHTLHKHDMFNHPIVYIDSSKCEILKLLDLLHKEDILLMEIQLIEYIVCTLSIYRKQFYSLNILKMATWWIK